MKKTLIDNSTIELSMAHAITECLNTEGIHTIRIATGYWDLLGTALFTEQLEKFLSKEGNKLQLLLGKDPYVYSQQLKQMPNISRTPKYPDDFIRANIEKLDFNEENIRVVNLLKTYCDGEEPPFEIRLYNNKENETQFLHSKCYIFQGKQANGVKWANGIVGSSNFTKRGLTFPEGNAELNFLEDDRRVVEFEDEEDPTSKGHVQWFKEKWDQSVPWNQDFLLQVLGKTSIGTFTPPTEEEETPQEDTSLTPYELYIKLLQTKFGDLVDKNLGELIESYLPKHFDTFEYQIDAVKQCFSTMKEHGGFMLADVVGLGKTIVGTLIIKHFLQIPDDDGRERKVLIITPPAIRSAWENTIAEFDRDTDNKMIDAIDFITTGSIGKLVDDVEEADDEEDNCDTGDFETELLQENYGLIIIDESHKFRNSGTAMYQALDDLITQIGSYTGTYPYIGLLSATPQNNRPDDLKNQIYLFERNRSDSTLTKAKSGNLEGFFSEINKEYDAIIKPKPDDFTTPEERNRRLKELSQSIRDNVLADIMVRRTRTDVQKYYAEDLKRQGIKFPVIKGPQSLNYLMDRELAQLFSDTMDIIAPTAEYKLRSDRYLNYYRYRAIQYLVDAEVKKKYNARGSRNADALAEQLAKIMQINLVKRLESSFSAFYQSLLNLRQYTLNMINMWDSNNIFICPQFNVNEELDQKAKEQKRKKKVTYEDCVKDIREKISKLDATDRNKDKRNMEYTRDDMREDYIDLLKADYKLISELCDRWAKNTEDPKLDVFKEKLVPVLFDEETNKPQKLVIFSEAIDTVDTIKRIAENKGYSVLKITAANRDKAEQTIRENFDANYKGEWKNDYQIIVTTEVLAEGINLHRANCILNYDTPWNSTRLMQRIGRVNRIGSTEPYVYVYNFKPSAEGDAEINLVQKAYTKLQSFHTLFGEDSQIYTEEEEVMHYDLNTVVNGEESPLEKYIYELKQFKDNNPERYAHLEQLEEGLELATVTEDGNAYFMVRTPHMSGLFVKIEPEALKGRIISAAEMYQNFVVPTDATSSPLPENWKEMCKKAERTVNQHLNKMNTRMGNSTKATKAKEIIREMSQSRSMSEQSKSLLADAFTLVNKGNPDIIKKILAFDERMHSAQGDLFGTSQEDFDNAIEAEISKIVANVQKRYGKAQVFIGLKK